MFILPANMNTYYLLPMYDCLNYILNFIFSVFILSPPFTVEYIVLIYDKCIPWAYGLKSLDLYSL